MESFLSFDFSPLRDLPINPVASSTKWHQDPVQLRILYEKGIPLSASCITQYGLDKVKGPIHELPSTQATSGLVFEPPSSQATSGLVCGGCSGGISWSAFPVWVNDQEKKDVRHVATGCHGTSPITKDFQGWCSYAHACPKCGLADHREGSSKCKGNPGKGKWPPYKPPS